MTNFDRFLNEVVNVDWIADAIENKLDCDICPAENLCCFLYTEDEAPVHCKATIVKWLEIEI
jgi:hypothetical protein